MCYWKIIYYGRAVDSTTLEDLSFLSAAQSQGTQETMDSLICFLDYTDKNPDATVSFYTPQTILTNHSDASFISDPKSCIWNGGYFYMGEKNTN